MRGHDTFGCSILDGPCISCLTYVSACYQGYSVGISRLLMAVYGYLELKHVCLRVLRGIAKMILIESTVAFV